MVIDNEIYITCPCCGENIVIDKSSGEISTALFIYNDELLDALRLLGYEFGVKGGECNGRK